MNSKTPSRLISHVGQDLKVLLLGVKGSGNDLKPVVWLTAREIPFREVK